jgi:hypothetical protein
LDFASLHFAFSYLSHVLPIPSKCANVEKLARPRISFLFPSYRHWLLTTQCAVSPNFVPAVLIVSLGLVAHRSLSSVQPEAWHRHCSSLHCEDARSSRTPGRPCLNVVNSFFPCIVSKGSCRLQGPRRCINVRSFFFLLHLLLLFGFRAYFLLHGLISLPTGRL